MSNEISEADGIDVNGTRIAIPIPPDVLEEAVASSREHQDRLAGMLAARTIESNPACTSSLSRDPVAVWGEIRDFILLRFGERKRAC